MADPFVAEIRVFPFNFAPKGWAQCNGQLMPISQNTALFALLGTTYGGDGKTTFALPDLQGRAPMAPGQGPGLTHRQLGEEFGSATHTLIESEIPAHQHGVNHSDELLNTTSPKDGLPGASGGRGGGTALYHDPGAPVVAGGACRPAGGGDPHQNLQPYLTLNFCIALQGVFPPRS